MEKMKYGNERLVTWVWCKFGGVLDWRGVIVRGMRERVLAMVSWREISKVEIRERNGEENHRERGSGREIWGCQWEMIDRNGSQKVGLCGREKEEMEKEKMGAEGKRIMSCRWVGIEVVSLMYRFTNIYLFSKAHRNVNIKVKWKCK